MLNSELRPAYCFKQRMTDRLGRWYKGEKPFSDTCKQKRRLQIAALANKSDMFDYAQKHSIPVPHRYAEVTDAAKLDFQKLPDRFVVKPNNTADGDCVMLFHDGIELFRGAAVPRQNRAAFVAETFAAGRFTNAQTTIVVEEFIADHDPAFVIPRDYKVYVAGGQAHVILVVDKNHPRGQWQQSFYTRDWTPIRDVFQNAHRRGPDIPPPARLGELLDLAERIAGDIGCFMRLDFYLAADRVVFGEFTPYPDAGNGYTAYADRMLCALMDAFPDEV
jgi:hypothetical protein